MSDYYAELQRQERSRIEEALREQIEELEALLFECLPFVNEYMAGRIEPWISYETRKRIREKGKEPA